MVQISTKPVTLFSEPKKPYHICEARMLAKLHIDSSRLSVQCSATTSLPTISPPERAKLEPRRRLLEGTNNLGAGIKKFGSIHKHTRDRSSSVPDHGLEENPRIQPRNGAEDDAGSVIKKNSGDNLKGLSGDGLFGEVHARCSTKCVAYGGNIPGMLEALDTIRDLDEALRPWAKSLNCKEKSIILKEQRGWERAMEIFEWFKRNGIYDLNVIHYTIMLRILGRARKWSHVENLWDEMMARGVVPSINTYGALIDVYSKGGRVDEAMVWFDRMTKQGMEPNEAVMAMVVQLYKKAGQFDKAKEFFNKWSSRKNFRHKEDATTRNVCLNPCTYNTLIDMYGKAGQLKEAFDTFAQMVNEGVKPTTVTLTTLIRIYGDHGRLDEVTLLMQKMQALRCPPNNTTYNTLIDIYGKAGKFQEASEAFSQMLREGVMPTTTTFNTMIHICGDHGRFDEVTSLMQKMEQHCCPPDTTTYNILMKLHVKYDDINMAASYFKKMKETGLEPDNLSYRTLLYAYAERHMVSRAEDLVAEMDKRGVGIDEFTQAALTRMYIEAGMLEKSWLWFRRFHLAGNMSSECYSANIDAFGENGHIMEAKKVFKCCQQRKKLSVLVCNVMIKAYGIEKNCYKACQLLDSMDSQGVIPDKCTYASLIHILAYAEMPHIAASYLRKMQEAGLVSNCAPYCAVISSFVKLGQLEMAEGLYKEMMGNNVKPDTKVYGVLINAFADAGRVEEATHYVIAMESAGLCTDTNKILISVYSNADFTRNI